MRREAFANGADPTASEVACGSRFAACGFCGPGVRKPGASEFGCPGPGVRERKTGCACHERIPFFLSGSRVLDLCVRRSLVGVFFWPAAGRWNGLRCVVGPSACGRVRFCRRFLPERWGTVCYRPARGCRLHRISERVRPTVCCVTAPSACGRQRFAIALCVGTAPLACVRPWLRCQRAQECPIVVLSLIRVLVTGRGASSARAEADRGSADSRVNAVRSCRFVRGAAVESAAKPLWVAFGRSAEAGGGAHRHPGAAGACLMDEPARCGFRF